MKRSAVLFGVNPPAIASALGFVLVVGACSSPSDAADEPESVCSDDCSEGEGGAAPIISQSILSGAGATDDCSAVVFKFMGQPLTAHALVMTNGHCVDLLDPVGAIADEPSDLRFRFYDNEENRSPWFEAERLLYATMERTDLAVFRLGIAFDELIAQGITVRDLAPEPPQDGTEISVVAGGEQWVGECEIEQTVSLLREGDYEWHDSLSLAEGCATFPGTSGAPFVSTETGEIVGINNTGVIEEGTPCDLDAPCEVGPGEEIIYRPGAAYGQQTADLYDCIDEDFAIDLSQPDCALPGAG